MVKLFLVRNILKQILKKRKIIGFKAITIGERKEKVISLLVTLVCDYTSVVYTSSSNIISIPSNLLIIAASLLPGGILHGGESRWEGRLVFRSTREIRSCGEQFFHLARVSVFWSFIVIF